MKMDSLILMIFRTRFPVQNGEQLKQQNNHAYHQKEQDLVFHSKYRKP
jgi:hypothetical protein